MQKPYVTSVGDTHKTHTSWRRGHNWKYRGLSRRREEEMGYWKVKGANFIIYMRAAVKG